MAPGRGFQVYSAVWFERLVTPLDEHRNDTSRQITAHLLRFRGRICWPVCPRQVRLLGPDAIRPGDCHFLDDVSDPVCGGDHPLHSTINGALCERFQLASIGLDPESDRLFVLWFAMSTHEMRHRQRSVLVRSLLHMLLREESSLTRSRMYGFRWVRKIGRIPNLHRDFP